jgi:hypothetical protein
MAGVRMAAFIRAINTAGRRLTNAKAPSDDRIREAFAFVPAEDRVAVVGREWYWLPRAGVSDSLLPVTRIERIVGSMTMRTVGTVERMVAQHAN